MKNIDLKVKNFAENIKNKDKKTLSITAFGALIFLVLIVALMSTKKPDGFYSPVAGVFHTDVEITAERFHLISSRDVVQEHHGWEDVDVEEFPENDCVKSVAGDLTFCFLDEGEYAMKHEKIRGDKFAIFKQFN